MQCVMIAVIVGQRCVDRTQWGHLSGIALSQLELLSPRMSLSLLHLSSSGAGSTGSSPSPVSHAVPSLLCLATGTASGAVTAVS